MRSVERARRALSAVSFFAALEPPVLEAVARVAVSREYVRDEVVLFEGEPSTGLYVVERGWLKGSKTSPEGREQVVRFVGPGESFNDISVFAGERNLSTVTALEAATVWVIRRDLLLQLLEQHPALARAVIANLAQRARHLATLVEDLSLRTVEARLARYLLDSSQAGAMRRRRWTTQAEIASRLGTVPDVLNRALHSLARDGLIEVRRHEILVRDPRGLERRAMLDH